MNIAKRSLAPVVGAALVVALSLGLRVPPAAPASPRVDVKLDTSEADAVLAILAETAAGRTVDESLWSRLFSTEPYVRLKKREAVMAAAFNLPQRTFEDADFRKFVESPEMKAKAGDLARTLAEWKRADITAAASRALAYLPAEAVIRAKVYPVIKPKPNSFVFELDTDPTIFLYLNPELTGPQFENTVAHEMHHVGHASLGAAQKKASEALPPDAQTAALYTGAFAEGIAMLAAAGGPDVHPHAVSRPEDRARWDRDMAKFDSDLREVEVFLLDIIGGRLKTEAEREERAGKFFGDAQGAWYTVGYRMSALVEKSFGRDALIRAMLDPRLLLVDYNRAAAAYNASHNDRLALWSPALIQRLDPVREYLQK